MGWRLDLEGTEEGADDDRRSSVQDMLDQNSRLHRDPHVASDLVLWHESRLFPSGKDGAGKGEREDDDEEAQEDDEQDDEDANLGGGGRERRAIGTFVPVNPEVEELVKKAEESQLRILK